MSRFPGHFAFGAAAAASRAEGALLEGNQGKNYRGGYLKEQGIFDPSLVSDFYHKYSENLKLCRTLGINGLRISTTWLRAFPSGVGKFDPSGAQLYHKLVDECIASGVGPFVTLHHFGTPSPLFEKSDWFSQKTIIAYVDSAEFCLKKYGNKVNYWIILNESWFVMVGQYVIGHFPPNIKYGLPKTTQVIHNMMVTHAKVVEKYKKVEYLGEIGTIHILEPKYGITNHPEDTRSAEKGHILVDQFLLDATYRGHYAEDTLENIEEIPRENKGVLKTTHEESEMLAYIADQIDFTGVNYYASHFVKAYIGESTAHHSGTGEKGSSCFALKGVGERVDSSEVPTTDWDWPAYPQGLENMLVFIKGRYPNYKKTCVTENGMSEKDALCNKQVQNDSRIAYVFVHLKATLKAIERGINVEGYFVWSLMDVSSWTNDYRKRYGLFYVDFKNQNRYMKKSAYWYKKIGNSKLLE